MSNGDVRIKVFASPKKQMTYDQDDENKIIGVIRDKVLPETEQDYHSVSVKVERSDDGASQALVAYMLRKDSYTADVTKVDVDQNYKVQKVTKNYDDSEETGDEAEEEREGELTYAVEEGIAFVAGTPVPEIPTARQAVENVAKLADKAGLASRVLLGRDATVANYKHYLSSGLKGFVNVGHGLKSGIVLDDGRLRYTWFKALANTPLFPSVTYFNSCQVHNPPLEPAVMSSGARTYIGGIVNLLIGPSEKVCKSFWEKVLSGGSRMKEALETSERDNYPSTGAHGFSGDHDCIKHRCRHLP